MFLLLGKWIPWKQHVRHSHRKGNSQIEKSAVQWCRYFRAPTSLICKYLGLVAGLRRYNLQDPAHVPSVKSAPYRSCIASHNGRLGSEWSRSWPVYGANHLLSNLFLHKLGRCEPSPQWEELSLWSNFFFRWGAEGRERWTLLAKNVEGKGVPATWLQIWLTMGWSWRK